MWKWSLNWGEVTPGILIGSCPMTPDDLEKIVRGARVSAVLSLQHDECLAWWKIDYGQMRRAGERLDLTMVRFPVRDFDIADMRARLPGAVAELAVLRARGQRVYVHCTAGLGRGPLTVLAYLHLIEGYSTEAAIRLVHAARPGAVPAWEAFHGCCADLVRHHRDRIARRAYELYQQGVHQDANADWEQAQAETVRSVLLGRTTDHSNPPEP